MLNLRCFLIIFLISSYAIGQKTYIDNFNNPSYSNDNGTDTFSTNWIEINDNSSVSSGKIRIFGNRLRFNDLDANFGEIQRTLNLTGTSSATLSFDWETANLYARTSSPAGQEELSVQISTDGTSFTTIGTFSKTPNSGSFSKDIAAYISATTTIRFINETSWQYGPWEGGDYAYIDNFKITATFPDNDLDGVLNSVDNCPNFFNPDQSDIDGDGIGDVCDDDADNDGIIDTEECNGALCLEPIINEGFENPTIALSSYAVLDESLVSGWQTTATDGYIEIWSTGFNGVPSFEGNQFAELNANENAALYQELCLSPGSVINWSLRHRGRIGTDVMRVRIGADIVSATQQGANISDGKFSWGYYSGSYTVPSGQYSTVFMFEAVSTANGVPSVGNFIDDIEIAVASTPPCEDFDNDGIPNNEDLDGDNDGIYDIVEAGNGNLDLDNDGRIDPSNGSVGSNGVFDLIETFPDSGIIAPAYEVPDTDSDGDNDAVDIDSDGDNCNDVLEAGFTQSGTKIGELQGTGYNSNGIVTGGTDGYTAPNDLDTNSIYDFQESGGASISTQPLNTTICTSCSSTFTVVGANANTYQWQIFNGSSWVDLTDTGIYNGTDTNTLTVANPNPSDNGNQYRAIVSNTAYVCSVATSSTATLSVQVHTVITNRRITYRVSKN